ncbi:MAG TPA: hypothetical protein PLS50_08575, partial [Candidatus Dojkabacteria bacterium]|nr:hypothetical protein [Candidatus Dojkabacteria bacterium]
ATNTSEVSYNGKDGEVKETSGAGADYIVGINRETEKTIKKGEVTNTKTTTDVSVAAPIYGGLGVGVVKENNQNTVKFGYVNGGSTGVFLNVSFSFEIGFQVKQKKDE